MQGQPQQQAAQGQLQTVLGKRRKGQLPAAVQPPPKIQFIQPQAQPQQPQGQPQQAAEGGRRKRKATRKNRKQSGGDCGCMKWGGGKRRGLAFLSRKRKSRKH